MDASEEDDFLTLPVEACVVRIRESLGLPAANDDTDDATPEVVIWRSSA